MPEHAATASAESPARREPVVRRVAFTDVVEAFAAGLRDFQRAPLYGLFFGAIYAIGGMVLVATVFAWGMSYLAYPLAAGFALITTACPTAADEASLRRRGVVVLNPEPGDALATWLRRGHANAAVVRPDRTVARAGRDVAALCAWTTGVLRER